MKSQSYNKPSLPETLDQATDALAQRVAYRRRVPASTSYRKTAADGESIRRWVFESVLPSLLAQRQKQAFDLSKIGEYADQAKQWGTQQFDRFSDWAGQTFGEGSEKLTTATNSPSAGGNRFSAFEQFKNKALSGDPLALALIGGGVGGIGGAAVNALSSDDEDESDWTPWQSALTGALAGGGLGLGGGLAYQSMQNYGKKTPKDEAAEVGAINASLQGRYKLKSPTRGRLTPGQQITAGGVTATVDANGQLRVGHIPVEMPKDNSAGFVPLGGSEGANAAARALYDASLMSAPGSDTAKAVGAATGAANYARNQWRLRTLRGAQTGDRLFNPTQFQMVRDALVNKLDVPATFNKSEFKKLLSTREGAEALKRVALSPDALKRVVLSPDVDSGSLRDYMRRQAYKIMPKSRQAKLRQAQEKLHDALGGHAKPSDVRDALKTTLRDARNKQLGKWRGLLRGAPTSATIAALPWLYEHYGPRMYDDDVRRNAATLLRMRKQQQQ